MKKIIDTLLALIFMASLSANGFEVNNSYVQMEADTCHKVDTAHNQSCEQCTLATFVIPASDSNISYYVQQALTTTVNTALYRSATIKVDNPPPIFS